jgi:Shedu protein SduA, C-terminal
MVEMRGEGTLQAGPADRWASLERQLRIPGVTLVVAPKGSGKTHFANRIARDKSAGRTIVLRDFFERDFDDLERRVRRELGSERPGDLIIFDRQDDLRAPFGRRRLAWLINQEWAENLHLLILTSKQINGAEQVFREVQERSQRQRTFQIVDFFRAGENLESQVLQSEVRREDAEALLSLIQSSSNLELTQTLISGAESRLSDDRSGTPDLLIVADRNDRLRVLPSTELGISDLQLTPSIEISATPRITYRKTRRFWLPEATRLEELINNPSVREYDLQEFFEENPHLLAGTSYDRVVPHPVLARDEKGPLIPDFMLEPADDFADVLDLKLPGVQLVTGRSDRLHQTAHVTEAIAQVREYRAYFDDPAHRQAVRDRYGIQAYRPTVAVVIGRDPGPGRDRLELRRIWDDLPAHARIMTYDQLLRQVRRLGRF